MLALLIPHGSGAPHGILGDPDNYMRLAQIRDWLAGQSWWDVTQYRVNPPDGLRMHWSRLGDIPVAALIVALEPVTGPDKAEWLAISVAPPMLLLATCCCLSRAGYNLFGTSAAVFAVLAAASMPQLLAEFVPGRIDHHGLQVLLLAVSLVAVTGSESLRNGLLAAFAATASLLIGLEAAPYHLLIAIWLAGRWALIGERGFSKMLGFAVGMAVLLPIMFLSTVPPSDWTRVTSDEVGLGHLIIIVCAGALLAALASRTDLRAAVRVRKVIAVSVFSAVILFIFPEVVRPPYSEVDSMMQRLWLDPLLETRSFFDVWATSPFTAVAGIILPLLAVCALVVLTNIKARRDWVVLLALLVSVGLILRIWQFRSGAIASIPLILVFSWLLASMWKKWSDGASVLPFAISLVSLNGAIVPSIVTSIDRKVSTAAPRSNADQSRCQEHIAAASLNKFPAGLVLAPIGLSAPILVKSHHSVLTASNHRNYEKNRKAYRAFLTSSDEARRQLSDLRIDYVLFCQNGETQKLANEDRNGLAASLDRGDAPDWLTLVQSSDGGGLRFYEVKSERPPLDPPNP